MIAPNISRWAGPLLRQMRPQFVASMLARVVCQREAIPTAEGTFWLDPSTNLGCVLIRNDIFEPSTVAALQENLGPGQTFVDLGANEGYFSVIASRIVGPSGRVIAIE